MTRIIHSHEIRTTNQVRRSYKNDQSIILTTTKKTITMAMRKTSQNTTGAVRTKKQKTIYTGKKVDRRR